MRVTGFIFSSETGSSWYPDISLSTRLFLALPTRNSGIHSYMTPSFDNRKEDTVR
jgi:hypothetical protein